MCKHMVAQGAGLTAGLQPRQHLQLAAMLQACCWDGMRVSTTSTTHPPALAPTPRPVHPPHLGMKGMLVSVTSMMCSGSTGA